MLVPLAGALQVQEIFERGDVFTYTAFTFFIGTMAMMAAAAFFFMEMRNMEEKWRTSILISGIITFIAAVHYYYMRDYFTATSTSPTFFRYVDWMLTVPLMCVEFYLITKNKTYFLLKKFINFFIFF